MSHQDDLDRSRDTGHERLLDAADAVEGGTSAILSSFYAEATTRKFAEATEQVFLDSANLERVLTQYRKVAETINQGRAFEFLEVLKFNRAHALAGNAIRSATTHFDAPTGPVDIEIQHRDTLLKSIQAKSYSFEGADRLNRLLKILMNPKYAGMEKLIPKGQKKRLLEEISQRLKSNAINAPERTRLEDLKSHLSDGLSFQGIGSRGTSREEALFATRHPRLAALRYEGLAALDEVGAAGLKGAAAGGGFGLLYGALSSGIRVGRGEISSFDAAVITVRATASGAVRAGTVSAGAKAIAITARRCGVKTAGGPIAAANAVFEGAVATTKYLKGETSPEQYREDVGGVAVRAAATYYYGLAGQVLIPIPVVGALAGCLAGYVAAATLVQSGVLGIGVNNVVSVARDRRLEIEAECFVAIQHIEEINNAIDLLEAEHSHSMAAVLRPSLEKFITAGSNWDVNSMADCLSQISLSFGEALPWRTLDDFDAFMADESKELKL